MSKEMGTGTKKRTPEPEKAGQERVDDDEQPGLSLKMKKGKKDVWTAATCSSI